MVDRQSPNSTLIEAEGFVMTHTPDPFVKRPEDMPLAAYGLLCQAIDLARAQPRGMLAAEALLGIHTNLHEALPPKYCERLLNEAYDHLSGQANDILFEADDEVFDTRRSLNEMLIKGFALLGNDERAIETVDVLGSGELPGGLYVQTPDGPRPINIDSHDTRWKEGLVEGIDVEAYIMATKTAARCRSFTMIFEITGSPEALKRARAEIDTIQPADEDSDFRSPMLFELADALLNHAAIKQAVDCLSEIPEEFPRKYELIGKMMGMAKTEGEPEDLQACIDLLPEVRRPGALAWLAKYAN